MCTDDPPNSVGKTRIGCEVSDVATCTRLVLFVAFKWAAIDVVGTGRCRLGEQFSTAVEDLCVAQYEFWTVGK